MSAILATESQVLGFVIHVMSGSSRWLDRKVDHEGRAFTRTTSYVYMTTMPRDNLMGNTKSETCAISARGEEWVKDARYHLLADTSPIVADFHAHES